MTVVTMQLNQLLLWLPRFRSIQLLTAHRISKNLFNQVITGAAQKMKTSLTSPFGKKFADHVAYLVKLNLLFKANDGRQYSLFIELKKALE